MIMDRPPGSVSNEIDPQNPGTVVPAYGRTKAVDGQRPYLINFLLDCPAYNFAPPGPPPNRQDPNQPPSPPPN